MHLTPETCLCNFIRMLRYLAQMRPHANQRSIDLKGSGWSVLVDGTQRPGASGKYSAAQVPTPITGRLLANSAAQKVGLLSPGCGHCCIHMHVGALRVTPTSSETIRQRQPVHQPAKMPYISPPLRPNSQRQRGFQKPSLSG